MLCVSTGGTPGRVEERRVRDWKEEKVKSRAQPGEALPSRANAMKVPFQ
jgi:hypothetical protein